MKGCKDDYKGREELFNERNLSNRVPDENAFGFNFIKRCSPM